MPCLFCYTSEATCFKDISIEVISAIGVILVSCCEKNRAVIFHPTMTSHKQVIAKPIINIINDVCSATDT